jgi:hypothetical protein
MARPIQALDVAPERVEWLWRERIPRGMITTIAGRPDQGKGLLASAIAADVTQDKPVASHTACKQNVLYSAIEDSHGIMTRPRLEAAGAILERILLWRFQLPAMFEQIKSLILANDIGLVVIDPFAASLSNGITRFSDNVRDVLSPLSEFIEQTGTSVIIIEHALKRVGNQGHVLDVIGGSSSGLPAASRAAYVFGVDPDDNDKRVMAVAKNNLRSKPLALSFEIDVTDIAEVGEVPSLEFEDELKAFDPMRLFQKPAKNGQVGRPPEKRSAAAEWLTMYLVENGPTSAGTIYEDAKQHNMNSKTLRRAADDMKIVRNPPGGGRNCTWDLNDEIKDTLGIARADVAQSAADDGVLDVPQITIGPIMQDGRFWSQPQEGDLDPLELLPPMLGGGEFKDGDIVPITDADIDNLLGGGEDK